MSQIDSKYHAIAGPAMPSAGWSQRWLSGEQGWLERIRHIMQACQAHPARTVVLVPYAQLMPVAAQLWARTFSNGFVPRFETSKNWVQSLGGQDKQGDDIRFDMAADCLTARALLEFAGMASQAPTLAPRLVETVYQLAPLAAAVLPEQRSEWAQTMRSRVLVGMDNPMLLLEAGVMQTAIVWAGISAYDTDLLFTPLAQTGIDSLIVLEGYQPDPLIASLQSVWGDKLQVLNLAQRPALDPATPHIRWHQAQDAQDEAQRAAACVLAHLEAGRVPVALVATDRVLTRRVRAMLEPMALRVRDENGWKLSTSRSAAQVMGALRACDWQAGCDAVLDWLKNSPALEASLVGQLEAALRREGVRQWHAGLVTAWPQAVKLTAFITQVQALRDDLKGSKTITQWLQALRALLETSGQWDALTSDRAGQTVLEVLHLEAGPGVQASWTVLLKDATWANKRLSLQEFSQWVNQVLEAASFKPEHPLHEQLVILPMSQMLARPFAAVVMPGCDEVRMNPSPEPPGLWTAAQRQMLGLPSREELTRAAHEAWCEALHAPELDVLWRHSDDSGESLMPSAWVLAMRLANGAALASDPRTVRNIATALLSRPAPSAPSLNTQRLSSSAYEDLRRCPYRFFALRQLGLSERDELDEEIGKRDFGLWLHAVLKAFHDALLENDASDPDTRRRMLDSAAAQVRSTLQLPEDEFLPFSSVWPPVRDGYLHWLEGHEQQGGQFVEGERWLETALGSLTLVGRVDRIDRVKPDNTPNQSTGDDETKSADRIRMVMDYKTETASKTNGRVSADSEDTQLAFYAALLQDERLRAAYVNVGESGVTTTYEPRDLLDRRHVLQAAIQDDMRRIDAGEPLPALGEGQACDYCAARGLCRKDFWGTA
jgi:ATP-dependent helicase/nuclease subunit B